VRGDGGGRVSWPPMTTDGPDEVVAEGLCAGYGGPGGGVRVLEDASFRVPRGSVTAVLGPSGSGKTTLLSLLGGLDRPERGRLVVGGTDLTALDEGARAEYRRRRVGFVFQSFRLLPTLTARENVEAGLEPLRQGRRETRRRAEAALEAVGLLALAHRFPHELSGGEQQRVGVARACAKEPQLLLADEPTGNLDEEIGKQVLQALLAAAGNGSRTLIVVTHDAFVSSRADQVLALRGRRIQRVGGNGA
jgi:putative ABC transport system ATP-binding protein